MPVATDNKRISVKLSIKEYEIIEKLAKEENRSVSNYIFNVLHEHLKSIKKD